MKNLIFSLTFTLLFMLTISSCKEDTVQITSSDEEIYQALQVPLIETIMNNGRTISADNADGQIFEYTFKGYISNLPYRIILSRNVQFEDCAGCIGDWKIGMFSPPQYNTTFISLREFIVQMVHSNTKTPATDWVWYTHNYKWEITAKLIDGKSALLIEVTSISDDRTWDIYVKNY